LEGRGEAARGGGPHLRVLLDDFGGGEDGAGREFGEGGG
jgi:hypothetical protein